MKKTITLLALSVIAIPQINAQNVVRVVRVTPVNVCNGDQVTVNFTLQPSPAIKDSAQWELDGTNETKPFHKIAYSELASLPTQMVNGINTHYFTFPIPRFYWDGPVFVQCDGDMLYTNYKTCATGINTYQENECNYEVKYFDLTGRPSEKRYNEVLIEQRGPYRRRVVFQE